MRFFERKLRKATNTLISGPVGGWCSRFEENKKTVSNAISKKYWSHLAYKLTSEPEIESQKIKRVPDGPRSRVGLGDSCKVASKAKNNPDFTGNICSSTQIES